MAEPTPPEPAPEKYDPPPAAAGAGPSRVLALPKRRGAALTTKMIFATTLLLVAVVVTFGALSTMQTSRIIDEASSERIAQFKRALTVSAAAETQAVALSSSALMIEKKEIELQNVVDVLAKSPDIAGVYFVYPGGLVAAHSDKTKYPPIGADGVRSEYQKIDDPSWALLEKRGGRALPTDEKDWILSPDGGAAIFSSPVTSQVSQTGEPTGEVVGTLVIGRSLAFLQTQTARTEQNKKEAQKHALTRTVAIGAIVVLLGIVLSIMQSLRISRPVRALANRANDIAKGDLTARVEVVSSDELGLLGDSFNFMADQLAILLVQTAEKATMEKELEVARAIQDTLVPEQQSVTSGPLPLSGHFQPASQCGGDWWTWHTLADGRILVVIGDVTGHGVPSAMITAAAKAACDTVRAMTANQPTITLLLESMNRAIFESAKRRFVMTCFASIYDPKTRKVTFGNAGHNFPYVYRQSSDGGQGDFSLMMTRGNRLGDSLDSRYPEESMQLVQGDFLVWYTDGIVECESEQGEEFGEKRFRAAIRQVHKERPDAALEQIKKTAYGFYGAQPRKDDITLVVAHVA